VILLSNRGMQSNNIRCRECETTPISDFDFRKTQNCPFGLTRFSLSINEANSSAKQFSRSEAEVVYSSNAADLSRFQIAIKNAVICLKFIGD